MLNNKQVSFATETCIYSILHTELCNMVSKLCPLTPVLFPIQLSRLHITICCTRNKAEFLENGRWFCEDRSHSGRSEKNDPNLGILLTGWRIHKIPFLVQFTIFQREEAPVRSEGRAGVEVKTLQHPHTYSLHIKEDRACARRTAVCLCPVWTHISVLKEVSF